MVWIKRLNNADTGDATHLGGNHWDLLDQYHDNVDISASIVNPPKIATPTTFKDQILFIRNAADTFSYNLKAGTLTANVDVSLPNASGDITLIAAGAANDWGAVVQTFRHQAFKIMNPGNSFGYIFNTSAIAANRAVTLPLLTTDDTLVTNAVTATLTNKTINVDSNVLKHSTTNAQGDVYKYDTTAGKVIRVARGSADQIFKVNAAGTDTGFETVAAGGGGAADTVKVYEGGVLVGTLARKLNFNSTDFNCSADTVNNEIDVALAVPGGGGSGGNSTTVYKNTTTLVVSNTTSETTLFSASVTGGTMGTNGVLHAIVSGWILNNSGGSDGFTFRLKLGATTLWQDDTETYSSNATRRPLHLEFWVKNQNSASAQRTTGTYIVGNQTSSTVGYSDLSVATSNAVGVLNGINSTVATASTQSLVFSVAPTGADTLISVNGEIVFVELIT